MCPPVLFSAYVLTNGRADNIRPNIYAHIFQTAGTSRTPSPTFRFQKRHSKGRTPRTTKCRGGYYPPVPQRTKKRRGGYYPPAIANIKTQQTRRVLRRTVKSRWGWGVREKRVQRGKPYRGEGRTGFCTSFFIVPPL